jgi:hypothetical protein
MNAVVGRSISSRFLATRDPPSMARCKRIPPCVRYDSSSGLPWTTSSQKSQSPSSATVDAIDESLPASADASLSTVNGPPSLGGSDAALVGGGGLAAHAASARPDGSLVSEWPPSPEATDGSLDARDEPALQPGIGNAMRAMRQSSSRYGFVWSTFPYRPAPRIVASSPGRCSGDNRARLRLSCSAK